MEIFKKKKRTDKENFDAAAAAERNWWKKRNSIWVEWSELVRIDTRSLAHTKQISNYFRYFVCFSSNFWRRARLRPSSIALYSQACGMSFEVSQPNWNNKIQINRTDGRRLTSGRKKQNRRTSVRSCKSRNHSGSIVCCFWSTRTRNTQKKLKRVKLIKYLVAVVPDVRIENEAGARARARAATINWILWKKILWRSQAMRDECSCLVCLYELPFAPFRLTEWVASQWIFIGLPMTTNCGRRMSNGPNQASRACRHSTVFFIPFGVRRRAIRLFQLVVGPIFTQFVVILFRWFFLSVLPEGICSRFIWFAVAFSASLLSIGVYEIKSECVNKGMKS